MTEPSDEEGSAARKWCFENDPLYNSILFKNAYIYNNSFPVGRKRYLEALKSAKTEEEKEEIVYNYLNKNKQ
jgi:hypothetical protein